MVQPVYVPTKGRADIAKAPDALTRGGVTPTLVVEPQDEAAYAERWPTLPLLVLPENDRGIVYVRQYILEHARSLGQPWYWQIDDNIARFAQQSGKRGTTKAAGDALMVCEELVAKVPRLALCGLGLRQHVWAEPRPFVVNRGTICCVLTNTATGAGYRGGTDSKEDYDFLLQHLTRGWHSVVVNTWTIDKPGRGYAKAGGLVPFYAAKRDWQAAQYMVDLWPEYCSLQQKRGRVDVKINWAAIDALWSQA